MELLSIEEGQKIIENSIKKNLTIYRIALTKLTGIMGFMGEFYNLKVYVKLKCYQYFVKSVPKRNPQDKEENPQKALRKEKAIFTNILPNLSKYANAKLFPDCYYARQDLLVLEDLTSNWQQICPNELRNIKTIKLILKNLAKLHASSIAWERAEGFSIGERYKDHLFEVFLTGRNEWFVAGVKGIVHLARKLTQFDQSFVSEKLFVLLMQSEKLVQPSGRLRNVFCHRDTSVSNIFINSNSQSVCFVDLGLATYCSPAIDIHFLLYISSPREIRQEFYGQLMEYYFEALQEEFINLHIPLDEITLSDFQLDCQRARLTALIISGLCLPLFKISIDLIDKLRKENMERYNYWMYVDRSELFDIAMEHDQTYRDDIYEIINELLVYMKDNEIVFK